MSAESLPLLSPRDSMIRYVYMYVYMYVWRVVCMYECVCIKVEVMYVCMEGGVYV